MAEAARTTGSSIGLRGTFLITICLFAVALFLRALGIDWGYGHGDERIGIAAKVMSGQLIPDNHYYPPFYDYINAAIFSGLYVLGRFTDMWGSTAEFRDAYFADDTIFFLAARFGAAVFAALVAPMFFLIGRGLQFSFAACLVLGLIGAFLPSGVLLSHISKSDVPLATSGILLILLVLSRLRADVAPRTDLAIGLTFALGLSFKQTFVLLAGPVLLVLTILLFLRLPARSVLAAAGRALLVALICLPVFNIGILLDLQNFLDYQKIQSVMSMREDPFGASLGVFLSLAGSHTRGISAIGLALFLAFPLVAVLAGQRMPQRAGLLLIWGSILLGTAVTIHLVGLRQHTGLWIMFFTAMHLFAGISLAVLISGLRGPLRAAGFAGAAALLSLTAFGIFTINQQALARPMKDVVAAYLLENHSTEQVLTLAKLDFPQLPEVRAYLRDRDLRLAEKYKVDLPPIAGERAVQLLPDNALHVLHKPIILWGLENADDEDLEGSVKAFAWPGQAEEWEVAYWVSRGYTIFAIANLEFQLEGNGGKWLKRYVDDLVASCEMLQQFEPVKTLYIEDQVTLFRCAPPSAS